MAKAYTYDERVKWLGSLHKIPASATVAIEDMHGRLLIVKATYKSYWTMPGGVIDPGESPRQAALREVKEETGLALTPDDVRFVGTVFRTSDVTDTYQFVFGAKISDDLATTIVLQEEEIAEYAFVSKEEVMQDGRMYASLVTRWSKDEITCYSEETVDLLAE